VQEAASATGNPYPHQATIARATGSKAD